MDTLMYAGYLLGCGALAVLLFLVVSSLLIILPGLALIYYGFIVSGMGGGLMVLVGVVITGFWIKVATEGFKTSALWTHEFIVDGLKK